MRAANEINLKMAPLTPDHHFYIDQGANAHVRLVLIALGEKLVADGRARPPRRRDHVPLQRAAGVHRRPDRHRRAGHRGGRTGQARGGGEGPAAGTGSAPSPRPSSRSRTSTCGASRTSSDAREVQEHGKVVGIAGSPGVIEGVARVVLSEAEFDSLHRGRDPRLPDDQPGLAGPVREDHRGRDRRGRDRRPTRPFSPASTASRRSSAPRSPRPDQDGRPPPRGRQRRRGRDPLAAATSQADPHAHDPRDTEISRSVLSDQVKDRLLQAILDGRYPPGSRIVETRVAREFGTSQAPVREALRDLEALGVVEVTAFRGARVRRPSGAELLEAFVVRAELESLAARLAIPRITDADLEQLAALRRRHAATGGRRRSPCRGDRGRRLPRPDHRICPATRPSGACGGMLEPFSRTYITIAVTGCRPRARSPTSTFRCSRRCGAATPRSSRRPCDRHFEDASRDARQPLAGRPADQCATAGTRSAATGAAQAVTGDNGAPLAARP